MEAIYDGIKYVGYGFDVDEKGLGRGGRVAKAVGRENVPSMSRKGLEAG